MAPADRRHGLLLRQHHPRHLAAQQDLPKSGRRAGLRRRPAAHPLRVGAQGRSGYQSGARLEAVQQPAPHVGAPATGHQLPAVPPRPAPGQRRGRRRRRRTVDRVQISAVVEADRREDDDARRRRVRSLLDALLRRQPHPDLLRIRIYSDYRIQLNDALSLSEIMALGHSAVNPLLYMIYSRRAVGTFCWQVRRRIPCPPVSHWTTHGQTK